MSNYYFKSSYCSGCTSAKTIHCKTSITDTAKLQTALFSERLFNSTTHVYLHTFTSKKADKFCSPEVYTIKRFYCICFSRVFIIIILNFIFISWTIIVLNLFCISKFAVWIYLQIKFSLYWSCILCLLCNFNYSSCKNLFQLIFCSVFLQNGMCICICSITTSIQFDLQISVYLIYLN